MGGNLVLFTELRQHLVDQLDLMSKVATEGDAGSALSAMRLEVPGLVAAFHALVDEHLPDRNGCCRKCRSGPFWRRTSMPCRTLIEVHLAIRLAKTAVRDRARSSSPQHSLHESSAD